VERASLGSGSEGTMMIKNDKRREESESYKKEPHRLINKIDNIKRLML